MFRLALVLTMSFAVSSQAVAAVKWNNSGGSPFQKATIAYEKGDYGAAFRTFTSLAEKGIGLLNSTWQKCIVKGKVFPRVMKPL